MGYPGAWSLSAPRFIPAPWFQDVPGVDERPPPWFRSPVPSSKLRCLAPNCRSLSTTGCQLECLLRAETHHPEANLTEIRGSWEHWLHYIKLIQQGRNRKFEKMNQILYSILILRILIDPKWAWLSYSTGQRVSGRWSLFWLRPSSLLWLNPIATRESLLGNHKLCSIFHIMFI